MTWFGWLLIGLIAASSLGTVAMVGKPRKPISPGTAAFIVLFDALLILGLVVVGV